MKNWKTTALGILAVLGAVIPAAQALLAGQPVDWSRVAPAVLAGLGLIFAKDHNVSGT